MLKIGILKLKIGRNMNTEEFKKLVETTCEKQKVKFIVSTGSYVLGTEYGTQCNGYFSNDPEELAISTGRPEREWFPVLVHEFCHMNQWSEDSPFWDISIYSTYLVDLWLDNKIELTEKQKIEVFRGSILVEHDCERRAIKLIKELDLPIDPIEYVQKANAYVLFYHVIMKHRKWYEIGKEPYNNPEIYLKLPTELIEDPLTISEEMLKIVELSVI